MKAKLAFAVALAVALVAAVALAVAPGAARAACGSRSVWFGAEHNALGNGPGVAATFEAQAAMHVTSVALSGSFIPNDGRSPGGAVSTRGWAEALLLVGTSPTSDPAASWAGQADAGFGPAGGYGGNWHGNGPTDSVLAAEILKSVGQAANQTETTTVDADVPAGSYLYLYGGIAGPVSDLEAQVVVTFTPLGC